MTKEEFIAWLEARANDNRARATDYADSSASNAFSLSCYYDGYADALMSVIPYLHRLED